MGTIAAGLMLPTTASAGSIESYGIYTANPGEVNNVTASGDGARVTLTDSAGLLAGPGSLLPGQGDCMQVSPTSVSCAYGNFNLQLGDMNDSFTWTGGAFPVDSRFTGQFVVSGDAGSDLITGSPYKDDLRGSANTTLTDPAGNDTILGLEGDDTVADSDGTSNTLDAGPGDDTVLGGTGQNTMIGGPGLDRISGGDGPDTMSGGDGADSMNGLGGPDTVLGEGGNDSIEGGGAMDVSDGGPGSDFLGKEFHAGGCELVANLDGGPDVLIGGPGPDTIGASCNTPILKLRDGEADKGKCAERVTSAVKEYDKKLDLIEGGACATLVCKSKKKKKKGKKSSALAAAKKGKKKKKKCKPYKAPEPLFE